MSAATQPAPEDGDRFTHGLEMATRRCKAKVEHISKECRRMNVRFRDIEFDLEEDRSRCLYGLEPSETGGIEPADVRRVKDIFEQPVFFAQGPGAGQVIQGNMLEDCWLLAAFSAISTAPALLERICVARDEKVGVYGFIFFMDQGWVDVVIDDQLYSNVPKYVELTDEERRFYKHNQELYDSIARKGSKTLYFTKSCHENETWIPLMEKAYAKRHGDFKSLRNGSSAEAMEDLTGGVTIRQHLKDILDEDEFWTELLGVTTDRLFTCYIHGVKSNDGNSKSLVNGLVYNHTYSIINAVEVKGKRFLKLRNPWGDTEWTGRWSDGSKEWISEWMEVLPAIRHVFGNDGEFIMQYEDFLKTFTMIGRTRLFDASWRVSCQWLLVHDKPFPRAWDYGEISYTFTIPKSTPVVMALSRTNKRAFADLDGPYLWTFDFKLFRRGEPQPLASSRHDVYWERSVPLEIDLEPGEYVVHVRLDRALSKSKTFFEDNSGSWNQRDLARKWALLAASRSLAINHRFTDYEHVLVLPEGTYAGMDLTTMEFQAIPQRLSTLPRQPPKTAIRHRPSVELSADTPPPPSPDDATADRESVEPSQAGQETTSRNVSPRPETDSTAHQTSPPRTPSPSPSATTDQPPEPVKHENWWCDVCNMNPIEGIHYRCMDAACLYFDCCENCFEAKMHNQEHAMLRINTPAEGKALDLMPYKWEVKDDLVLGLRVYTKADAPTAVKGQLRHGRMVRWTSPDVESPRPSS